MKHIDSFVDKCVGNGYISQDQAPWLRYMKFVRKLFTLMLAILLVASISVPAMAATNTERSAMNYSYTLSSGQLVGTSSNSMVHSENGGWEVNVNYISTPLPGTYAMLWMLNSEWNYCLGSNTAPLTGTGRVVGSYVNSNVIGWNMWMGVLFDVNDPSMTSGLHSYGTWSADAS